MGTPWIVPQLPGQPCGLPELLSVFPPPPGLCFLSEHSSHVGTPGQVSQWMHCRNSQSEGLPTFRSMFISLFSPLKAVFVTGLCRMDTGNVCGPGCVWGTRSLPLEIPFPSRIDPAEPHLGFSRFPEGQAGWLQEGLVPGSEHRSLDCVCAAAPAHPCGRGMSGGPGAAPGQEEEGAGSAWWESHPAAPTTSFFPDFFFFFNGS